MVQRICPRCALPLEPFERALPGNRSALTEMCVECGGLWLDDACLRKTFPELVDVVIGASQGPASSQSGGCPACGADMNTFALESLALDTCPGCGGLWLDGPEVAQIEEVRRKAEAELLEGAGGYRESARRLPDAVPAVACTECGREVSSRAVDASGRCRLCVEAMRSPIDVPTGIIGRLLNLGRKTSA